MKPKITSDSMLAIGLLGGAVWSHYFAPVPVFAQSSEPVLIPASAQPLALTTTQGIRLADFYAGQGTIKLAPVVRLRLNKTDRAVTLELSK